MCNHPCKDFIYGGCGNEECSAECHQPKEYYEEN